MPFIDNGQGRAPPARRAQFAFSLQQRKGASMDGGGSGGW
jgi:hypothetical protein